MYFRWPQETSGRSKDTLRPSRCSSDDHTSILDRHIVTEGKQVDTVDFGTLSQPQPEDHQNDKPAIVADAPDINVRMTSVPTPRSKRTRRIDVTTDHTSGAPGALKMLQSSMLEAATSSSNAPHERTLFQNSPPLEEVFSSAILDVQ